MNLFGMMDQSGTAMQAERVRAEVVAANMANAETTRTAGGKPYQRQLVVFAAGGDAAGFAGQIGEALPLLPLLSVDGATQSSAVKQFSLSCAPSMPSFTSLNSSAGTPGGVHIAAVIADMAPPLKRFDPGHPDADAEGYVAYPDINPLTEMVDLMGATRAYGLNSSAVQAEKSMIASSLEIAK